MDIVHAKFHIRILANIETFCCANTEEFCVPTNGGGGGGGINYLQGVDGSERLMYEKRL